MQSTPKHAYFDASQARLSYFEWGNKGASPILLTHATGFHARVWDKTIAALPDEFHIIAVELRGHGRSPYSLPIDSWLSIAQDVGELIQALSLRDLIGVGHSMGGHCMTQLAHDLPEAFRRLVLIDPVLSRPDVYDHDRYADLSGPQEHPIAARRSNFSSWEEMRNYFKERHPYSLWRLEVLEDYCRFGLLPVSEGEGYELACAPLVEASVYFVQRHAKINHIFPKIKVPVTILRAQVRTPEEWQTTNFTKSPTWEALADQFPNGRDVYLPNFTHFIPMQDPVLVARFIADEHAQLAPAKPKIRSTA